MFWGQKQFVVFCPYLLMFALLINPVFHGQFQPITWAYAHFQFIIQAQGQNSHGGLAVALTLQLKRLSFH